MDKILPIKPKEAGKNQGNGDVTAKDAAGPGAQALNAASPRVQSPVSLSKPVGDRIFRSLTVAFSLLILAITVGIATVLWVASSESFKAMGFKFLFVQQWNPVTDHFGALAFVYGTVVSSFIAFLLAAPFGIGIALFLTEMAPRVLKEPVSFLVEILAAIPSVVYGLWGIFMLAPFINTHLAPFLIHWIGKPLFTYPSTGLSLLSAGVILAVMILPTIMAVTREVFQAVPRSARESALALGATRWEAITAAVLLPSKPGVFGAMMLGLGRALGETMAVTMIIGNRPEVSANLLGPSHSIASVIANEFAEATSDMHLSALAELGLVLMGITFFINILARLLVWSTSSRASAARSHA